MSKSQNTFGDKLRLVRSKSNLSQTGLANATGLKPSAINHFEQGRRRPSIENLVLLADALEVSTDLLLGRETSFVARPAWRKSKKDKP